MILGIFGILSVPIVRNYLLTPNYTLYPVIMFYSPFIERLLWRMWCVLTWGIDPFITRPIISYKRAHSS